MRHEALRRELEAARTEHALLTGRVALSEKLLHVRDDCIAFLEHARAVSGADTATVRRRFVFYPGLSLGQTGMIDALYDASVVYGVLRGVMESMAQHLRSCTTSEVCALWEGLMQRLHADAIDESQTSEAESIAHEVRLLPARAQAGGLLMALVKHRPDLIPTVVNAGRHAAALDQDVFRRVGQAVVSWAAGTLQRCTGPAQGSGRVGEVGGGRRTSAEARTPSGPVSRAGEHAVCGHVVLLRDR